jgi:hypothetical protein
MPVIMLKIDLTHGPVGRVRDGWKGWKLLAVCNGVSHVSNGLRHVSNNVSHVLFTGSNNQFLTSANS